MVQDVATFMPPKCVFIRICCICQSIYPALEEPPKNLERLHLCLWFWMVSYLQLSAIKTLRNQRGSVYRIQMKQACRYFGVQPMHWLWLQHVSKNQRTYFLLPSKHQIVWMGNGILIIWCCMAEEIQQKNLPHFKLFLFPKYPTWSSVNLQWANLTIPSVSCQTD